MLKRDCYWYHCEHQMGASIDCCTLANGLGDCPCSDDCHDYITNEEVTKLLKTRKPRVMEWDEVKKKINSGEYVFTECEKEGQWVRYGNAKLSVDQGDSCIIAFLSSGSREENPHAIWWWISYKNYNKTWRCWTIPPTYAQMGAVK